jgi:hypothetical protein
MIPKIIWQTHEWEYQDLPEVFKKTSYTWRNLNPEWEYRYFSGKDREYFISEHYPLLLETYLEPTPFEPIKVRQADIWRYCIVHKHGGVYADMDSVCIKSLDHMLEKYNNEDLLVLQRNMHLENKDVHNCNFAGIKNSKLLKDIIDDLYQTTKLNKFYPTGADATSLDTWIAFSKYAQHIVDGLFFDASNPSLDYKTEFKDFLINYYGEEMRYSEYINRKGLDYYK